MADGSVKLGDFGISKSLSTQTNLALTACGTPFYFSPELINSQSYREPTDVWALGVLLFELLTLQRPFNGGNIAVLALAITNGAYDEKALELSPYPQWMRRLASKEKLLHPDPDKRLPLPELLAAVGGLNGDESEASGIDGWAMSPEYYALRNYELFHQLKRGSATHSQVAASSAGIDGWAMSPQTAQHEAEADGWVVPDEGEEGAAEGEPEDPRPVCGLRC